MRCKDICQDCDLYLEYGSKCIFYFKGKKSCSKREVLGKHKPIYEHEEVEELNEAMKNTQRWDM